MRVYLHAVTVYQDLHDGKIKLQVYEQHPTCSELVNALEMIVRDCALKADSQGLTLFEGATHVPSFVTAPHWPNTPAAK